MSESSVVGLSESLHDIADHRKTGVLRLSVNGRFRMAFFEEGELVYVVSDAPEESLAAYFTRAGRFESAAERLVLFQLEKEVTRKKSLVSLVLEQNLRDADTVRVWLADYAFDVFGRAYDTPDATAKFTGGIQAEHPLPIRVDVSHLILEAVHRMENEGLIRSFVGSLSQCTAPAEGFTGRLTSLPLSFFDGLVASQITAEAKLEDLLIVTGIPEAEVLKALVALRLSGVIEPFHERRVSDTDRLLRQRQEAVESGFVVDSETAAAAIHMAASMQSDDDHAGAPITMGEFDGTAPYVPPAPVQRGHSAPLQYPAPRPRGDTGRLKLLASAYIQMGESEAAAGNFAAAVQCFESALSQKPNDIDTLVAYARVLAKRPGGMASADKVLRQASERNPRSIKPLVELARLYHKAGKNEEAEDLLDEARRIEPINAEIRRLTEDIRKSAGGGLLAKFGFRSDSKVKAPPPKPAVVSKPPSSAGSYAQSQGADLPAHMKCRNCGRPRQGQLRFCRFCGATQ